MDINTKNDSKNKIKSVANNKNGFKNAVFDADGTIFNTFDGVFKCLNFALASIGKEKLDVLTARRFLGPSLNDSFTNILGLTKDEAQKAIGFYRTHYEQEGIYDCTLMNGFPEIFSKLQSVGIRISIASTKPLKFLQRLVEKFNIAHYFDEVQGPTEESKTSSKTELLKNAIVASPAIMIGDRLYDILAAREAGIKCIGVTFGFCEDGEFDKFKPDFVASNTDEIFDIITGNYTEDK